MLFFHFFSFDLNLKRARALVIVPSPALFSALLIYLLLILSPYLYISSLFFRQIDDR